MKYKPGPTNIADYLSRHPLPSQPQRERLIAEEYVNYLVGHDVPKAMTLKEINLACQTDPVMQRLRQAITIGVWPADDHDLMPFRKVQLELTAANDSDIILRGTRIIIPQSLQLRAVKLAHESHQGIVKTKQLLREKVWYPVIDKDVKIEVESCIPCQATGSATKPEPLQMTELPPAPWTRVSTDFCGPFPSGDHLLVIMDDYSRYPEVEIVRSTAATTIIPKLDRIFATHGIPDIVKSDNGPPFSGHEFAAYADAKGFQHQKITPLWPAANGEAERFMRTLSKTVKTSSIEGKNWKQDIQQFLLQYRATPHSTTGKSPAELLFGRPIKTKLPNVPPTVPGDEKVRMKDYESEDYRALIELVDEVEAAYCQLQELNHINILTTRDVDHISEHLPSHIRVEWIHKYHDMSSGEKINPFPYFMKFLKREREAVTRLAENQRAKKRFQRHEKGRVKGQNYQTHAGARGGKFHKTSCTQERQY